MAGADGVSRVGATLDQHDLGVVRELADIAQSFRFLLDLTPVNVESAKRAFLDASTTEPAFE
jgi:hypothetical protein